MAKYAENTTVSPESSQLEIQRLLTKYGATKFLSGWEENQHVIAFEMRNRRIRFNLRFPELKSFRHSEAGRYRTDAQMKVAQQAEIRRLWRVLVLGIKSKLELFESGVFSFEDEFLAYTILPTGETFGERVKEDFDRIMTSGQMPPLLPSGR